MQASVDLSKRDLEVAIVQFMKNKGYLPGYLHQHRCTVCWYNDPSSEEDQNALVVYVNVGHQP